MKKHLFLYLGFLNALLTFGQYENALIPYRLKNKWGYCDVNGNIKIKPVFEKVELFNKDGYAIVVKNGKYRLIDSIGKYTFAKKFKHLKNFEKEDINYGYFIATNFNNSKYSINSKGQKVGLSVKISNRFHCGGVITTDYYEYHEKDINSLKNKIRNKEKNYVEKKYGEGAYYYFKINKDTFIYCIFRNNVGILNSTFKTIVPFKYQRIEEFDGLFKVYPVGGFNDYFGLYSTSGIELLSPHTVLNLNDSLLLLIKNAYIFGVFNLKKLAVILPVEYEKIILLKDNKEITFLVSNNRIYSSSLDYHNFRNFSLINGSNKPITDTVFKEMIMIDNQDSSFFIANTSEGWNKFNLLGEKMFKESYYTLVHSSPTNDSNKFNFKDVFFIVSKFNNKGEKKYGVINIDDSIHVPFEFDEIEVCTFKSEFQGFFFKNTIYKNNNFLVKKDNKLGLITVENQLLLPLIYKKIQLLEFTPFAYVELENGKTGYINYITGVKYFKD